MALRQLKHIEIHNFVPQTDLIVWCETMKTPENIGGIFRTAEAMGVTTIYWRNPQHDLRGQTVTTIARKTNRKIKSIVVQDPQASLMALKSQGYTVAALELTTASQNVYEVHLPAKLVLVVGSESMGVSQEVLALCDEAYCIPMYGIHTSINVATALGIGLSALRSLEKKL